MNVNLTEQEEARLNSLAIAVDCTSQEYLERVVSRHLRVKKGSLVSLLPKLLDKSTTYFGISGKELFSKKRERILVDPRKCVSMYALDNFRIGVVDMGKATNRNHSTISAHKRDGKKLLESDKSFRKMYYDYEEAMNEHFGM